MKAVMYGAGNIGRGFIGQVFSLSGYDVTFIDVSQNIIDMLNKDNSYPVCVVDNGESTETIVKNVSGVNGLDEQAVAEEIAHADIMATAVGVNILPRIAKMLALGIKKRFSTGNLTPLDIIICENKIGADEYLRQLVNEHLDPAEKELADKLIGFVEASIGRMVPVQTDEMKAGNPLRVCVEKYSMLPVDSSAFKGEIPKLNNLQPFSPFSFYIKRKLFIHNMGHATTAYLGNLLGYDYIWQAIGDTRIKTIVEAAMKESASAISAIYNFPLDELFEHIDDLLIRFANRSLMDTSARVGGDPKRKLSAEDRMAGAINECLYQKDDGVFPTNICVGLAAATLFCPEGDPSATEIQSIISSEGLESFLQTYCNIKDERAIYSIIAARSALALSFNN